MTGDTTAISPDVPPSGDGCVECLAESTWWWHLRRCAQCGHVGCCDSSPQQHASRHALALGHPIARSFEPGERWFWNYETSEFLHGPELAPPDSRPVEQGAPAPKELVPTDWRSQLHSPPSEESAEGD